MPLPNRNNRPVTPAAPGATFSRGTWGERERAMDGTDQQPRPSGRWVGVRLHYRHVRMDDRPCATGCPEDELTVSYPGILISSYDDGELVEERWVPLGADPSEDDDEALIERLRAALWWQLGETQADS